MGQESGARLDFFSKEGSGIFFNNRHSFFWNGTFAGLAGIRQLAGLERLPLLESSDPMTKDFCVRSVGRTQQPDLSYYFHLV